MKEFRTKEGGRKIYNEDFANLQELVTSISGFLADCKLNFVISGCEVLEDRVKSGYVFLEGQIRKVEETSIKMSDMPVITPITQVINKKYEDGNISEIATIYATKIIPANKFTYGIGIIGTFNDTGKIYGFKSIIDTFWNAYTIIKNSQYPQSMDVLAKFTNSVFAQNAVLKKQGKNIKIDGDTISLYINDTIKQKIQVSSDGEIAFIGKDGNVCFKFNKIDETKETLHKVFTYTLDANVISAKTLMAGNYNVKEAYYTVEEYADTGWHNLIRVSTGEEIQGIKARSYLGMVHIQGTLPQDFFSNVSGTSDTPILMSGYYYIAVTTDIKLPDCIPSPSSDYINSFNVISPIFGTVGANIFIRGKSKNLYIISTYSSNKVGELSPATDDGIAMFSFPFYALNYSDNQNKIKSAVIGIDYLSNKRQYYDFPDQSVCPSVSWQYSADVPVELYSFNYSDYNYIRTEYNPDSYILHVFAEVIRTKVRTNLTTGESEKSSYYMYPEVESISYYYCLFNEYDQMVSIPTNGRISIDLKYITDPSVNQYDGYYSKDKEPLTGSEKWMSKGYDMSDLKTVPKTIKANAGLNWYDKISIQVRFKDTVDYKGLSDELGIYGMKTKFHLGLTTHIFWQQLSNGWNRKSCDLFILKAFTWEYYEYRIKSSYYNRYEYYSSQEKRKCSMSIFAGDQRLSYCWNIDEGAEYLEKISAPDGYNADFIYFTWSEKALTATKKFRISAHLEETSGDKNKKQAFIEINPNDVTLVKYSKENKSIIDV